MTAGTSEVISFGDRALEAVVGAMPRIRFDGKKRSQLYAVTLHATIIQLCGGTLALAKTEYTAGMPVLLRSLYEALVDLDLLVSDPSHHERMDAANVVQMLTLLEQGSVNPLLAGLGEKHDIATLTADLQTQLDDLKSRNKGAQRIRARCIAAGRGDEYSTIYASLCLDGHNNVSALMDRHVNFQEELTLEVNLFGDGDQAGVARRVFWGTGWMLQSAQFVHGAFRTGYDGIAELQREHETFRSRI